MDHEAKLRAYLERRIGVGKNVMRTLPASVDLDLAVRVVLDMSKHPFAIGRYCQRLPAPVIRAVLARDAATSSHVFVKLAVPLEGGVVEAWREAVALLYELSGDCDSRSQRRRTRIGVISRDARMLSAIRGTVANCEDVKLDMLAVLVADGSPESFDALVGHVERAFAAGGPALAKLLRLRLHARSTPALDALFAEIDAALR